MRFSKYIESQSVPEWHKAYLNYKGSKAKLKQVENYYREKEWMSHKLDSIDHGMKKVESNEYYNSSPSISSSRSTRLHLSRSDSMNSVATLSILDEIFFHLSESERSFFCFLDDESEKITTFYQEKEYEARLKLDAIKLQIKVVTEYSRFLLNNTHNTNFQLSSNWFMKDPYAYSYQLSEISSDVCDQKTSYNVARNRLKKAITEYYTSLEFLKSYTTINATGFQKMLHKFDKISGWKASPIYLKELKQLGWFNSKKLDTMLSETETIFVSEFTDGQRKRGMKALRGGLENEKDNNKTTLRVGIFLGMTIPLLFQSFLLAIDPKTAKQLPNLQTNNQIYACFLLPLLFFLGFSINLVVWSRSRINYKLIFELDTKDHLNHHQFPELPAFLLFISSIIIYLDLAQVFQHVPSEIYPLSLFIIIMTIFLCPFNIFYFSARKWLCATLGRVFLSYCFPVEFRDFFIADELNSLSYSIWTSSYFFCAYSCHWKDLETNCSISKATGFSPFLAALPPWWRLLQCFRRFRDSNERVHLLNAAKYINSILVALAAGLKRIYPSLTSTWIIIAICNSCYTCIWDIKMDWGLCRRNKENFLLRDELVFYKWTYYVAIVLNILLRFSWIIMVLDFKINGQLLGIGMALLEIYRRIQWNFFRLENEHLNNCGQYRAIKDIQLPFQFHSSTLHDDLFYGVRDFENKQDDDEETKTSGKRLVRKNSNIESILSRIRSVHEGDIL